MVQVVKNISALDAKERHPVTNNTQQDLEVINGINFDSVARIDRNHRFSNRGLRNKIYARNTTMKSTISKVKLT